MTFEQISALIMADNQGKVPLYSASKHAKIVIIGQAPGLKTQQMGQCFRDKSGDILRQWLAIDEYTFYESQQIAILPMDFYYPGKAKVGDLPPRKDFAPKWHPMILKQMPQIELIILVGNYAQKYYLGKNYRCNLTETVRDFQEYLSRYFPIVHPSPLNNRWLHRNPWFIKHVIPDLQMRVHKILGKNKGAVH